MVKRHSTVPTDFVCLSDVKFNIPDVRRISLTSDFSGWWSKLELFKQEEIDTDKIVYFDLDTVLVNNIDDILLLDTEFAALGGWVPGPNIASKENFGSGMMIWKKNLDLKFLYEEYKNTYYRHGDREYIVNSLLGRDIHYDTLQELITGIYSYKRNCLTGIPQDARIICFHGKPRPRDVSRTIGWVRSYWR